MDEAYTGAARSDKRLFTVPFLALVPSGIKRPTDNMVVPVGRKDNIQSDIAMRLVASRRYELSCGKQRQDIRISGTSTSTSIKRPDKSPMTQPYALINLV